VKFGTGDRDNMSPQRGENRIFGPLSKRNIGMAALRADLSANMMLNYYEIIG